MYPQANAELVRNAMKETRSHMDAEGELDLSQFQDAVALMMEFFARKVASGDGTANPMLHQGLVADASTPNDFLSDVKHVVRRPSLSAGRVVVGHLSLRKSAAEKEASGISPDAIAVPRMCAANAAVDTPANAAREPHSAAARELYDAAAASVVHLKTSGCGMMLGHVSATNLPDELADLYKHTPSADVDSQPHQKHVLASTVVARLVSRGFAVAGMMNAETAAGKRGGEVIYLLVRQGAAGSAAKSSSTQSAVCSSRQSDAEPPQPRSATPPPQPEEEHSKPSRRRTRKLMSNDAEPGLVTTASATLDRPPPFDNYVVQASREQLF
jgi:hypothetical protein